MTRKLADQRKRPLLPLVSRKLNFLDKRFKVSCVSMNHTLSG